MKPIAQLNFKKKQVMIFDMDGTLVDDLIRMMNQTIARQIKNFSGHEVDIDTIQKQRDEFIKANSGSSNVYKAYNAYMVEYYKFNASADAAWNEFKQILPSLVGDLKFKSHAAEFLAALKEKGFKLVLATNNVGFVFEAMQKNKNLHINNEPFDKIFDLIVSSGDVKNIKPAPDIYLKVLEKLQTTPEKCLVFEDALTGVQSAKAAGIEVVNAPDGNADKDRAEINKLTDYRIDSYKELLALLRLL